MKDIFKRKGYRFFLETCTNQQFILLENAQAEQLRQKVGFDFWEWTADGRAVVRFATSWATTDEDIAELARII